MARKGFYINDELVLKKLEEVGNQSEYVTRLILNDILSEYQGVGFEKYICGVMQSIIIQINSVIDELHKSKSNS